MVMSSVDVVPADAISLVVREAFSVLRRDDVDFVARLDKALRKGARMVLHAAYAVARDSDDTNPHGRAMLAWTVP
jgi:hypothetical protein